MMVRRRLTLAALPRTPAVRFRQRSLVLRTYASQFLRSDASFQFLSQVLRGLRVAMSTTSRSRKSWYASATPAIDTCHPCDAIRIPAGPSNRRPRNDWAYCCDSSPRRLQCIAYAGHRKNRADACHRITGRQQNHFRRSNRLDHARRRFRVRRSGESNLLYRILIPALHEIFLETKFANRRARLASQRENCSSAESSLLRPACPKSRR